MTSYEELFKKVQKGEDISTYCVYLSSLRNEALNEELEQLAEFLRKSSEFEQFQLLEYLHTQFGFVLFSNMQKVMGVLYLPGCYPLIEKPMYSLQQLNERFSKLDKDRRGLREGEGVLTAEKLHQLLLSKGKEQQ